MFVELQEVLTYPNRPEIRSFGRTNHNEWRMLFLVATSVNKSMLDSFEIFIRIKTIEMIFS